MALLFRSRIPITLALLLCLLAPASPGPQQPGDELSTPEQIKGDFDSVPCKNEERLNAVRTLFERMGAPPSDISVDKYKNVENLIVLKRGVSGEKVVIGAHYDKVAEGCGAIDNWSGIVTLAHIYRTLKDAHLKKTLVFVAFGKEEKGLVGSHAMVEAMTKEQLEQFCAMVNVDSFGLASPQAMENASSPKLTSLAAELAKQMKMPFGISRIEFADADSSSFLKRSIPALTLHGLSNKTFSVIHTSKDQPSKVNHLGVYLGYRLALALVVSLSESPCHAYR